MKKMNKVLLLSLLSLLYQTASAQLVTESFGIGANAFSMDFVTIGNPNNAADTTGAPNPAGSVAYTYNLGKYEVSRDQINKANLGITMSDLPNGNGVNRPATGITWYEAATYVNWLNTSTRGTAAYKFDSSGNFQLWSAGDAGYNVNNLYRNSLAKFWLPSLNEWYKGAYANLDGTWNNYATGSDSAPTAVTGGTVADTAVYNHSTSVGPADITDAGGLSPYGTMAQGGNVWEWTEKARDDIGFDNREMRGGSWNSDTYVSGTLTASYRGLDMTGAGFSFNGFRVASVPEPSALSLLTVGLGGLAMMRRRRL